MNIKNIIDNNNKIYVLVEGNDMDYLVLFDFDSGLFFCTCPSNMFRKNILCKHQRYIISYMQNEDYNRYLKMMEVIKI